MYYFVVYLLKIVLSLFGRMKIYNKSNLPKSGGYIIACTHTGWVDIFWLGITVLPVKIHYMAKKELFQSYFSKWLMKQLNTFPVNRENPGPSSIKIPLKLLLEGKIVGIFPSGTRTSEGAPLKRGAVTIACLANAPILPVAYVGPNNFRDLFKRKNPAIIFGNPITIPKDKPKKEKVEFMLNELNNKLNKLQKELLQKY